MKLLRFLLIFAIGLFSTSAYAYQLNTLPNGLKIITEENHTSKVIAASIWVKVGSADESAKEAGISHLIEHMTFRGSKLYKPGMLAKVVEENGGRINAFTSKSETVFHFVIPSDSFGKVFPVFADAVIEPLFKSSLIAKEKKPVLEEYRMDRDEPSRRFINAAIDESYGVKRYGRPTIGYPANIRGFSRSDLVSYHSKWYVPNNMVVVAVGDFNTASMVMQIKKIFGKLKRSAVVHIRPAAEPHGFKFFHIDAASERDRLFMSYPIPNIKNPNSVKLDLLADILGGSEASRLNKALIETGPLADSVYAYAMTPLYPGLFIIQAVSGPKKILSVYKTILSQIRKIQADGVSKQELDDAKLSLTADFIRQRSTIPGRAMQLGQFAIMNMLNFESQYIERLKTVTQTDIKQTARRYLNSRYLTVGTLYNKQVVFGNELKQLSLKKISAINEFTLKNGIRVIIKENHSAETVSVISVFKGGQLLEPKGEAGISRLTAAMLTRGSKGLKRVDILEKLNKTAAFIGGFSGKNSIGLSGSFLARFFKTDFKMFGNLLLHPIFPDSQLRIAKKEALDAMKRENEQLNAVLFRNVNKSIYNNYPYSRDELGDAHTIKTISRNAIVNFYKNIAVPKNMVISIVGDINTKTVLRIVKETFGNMKEGSTINYPAFIVKPEYKPIYIYRNVLQSHIAYSWITGGIKSKTYPVLGIISAALSGQSGILFTDLRDKHGTSYTATSFLRPGIGIGSFVIYLATRKGNLKHSLTLLNEELIKLKSGLSKRKIDAAKRYLVGNLKLSLLSNAAQAQNYALDELYGLGYLYNRKYYKKIAGITYQEVNSRIKKLLNSKYLIAILGPEKP